MKKLLLLLLMINISGCGVPVDSNNLDREYITPLKIEGLETNIQSLNNQSSQIKIKKFEIKDFGFRNSSHDDYDEEDDQDDFLDGLDKDEIKYEKEWNYNFKPTLKINDVLYNGQSILKNGTGEIKADFSNDRNIELILKGNFKTWKPIRMKDMEFDYQSGLLQQSIVGNRPRVRVLLDDSIIMKTLSVSENEIKVNINSKLIPEFYLSGLHKLTFEARKYYTETLIKVGQPEPVTGLSPVITKVEVLKNKKGRPINLKLTGKNFMMYYRFAYTTINSVFGYVHQTNILSNGTYETVIHIPEPKNFDLTKKNTIMYSTPFGIAFKAF